MTHKTSHLLHDIERFLDESGMAETYFGKRAVGNSELVSRLRGGGRVWPETEKKARAFIKERRSKVAAAA